MGFLSKVLIFHLTNNRWLVTIIVGPSVTEQTMRLSCAIYWRTNDRPLSSRCRLALERCLQIHFVFTITISGEAVVFFVSDMGKNTVWRIELPEHVGLDKDGPAWSPRRCLKYWVCEYRLATNVLALLCIINWVTSNWPSKQQRALQLGAVWTLWAPSLDL